MPPFLTAGLNWLEKKDVFEKRYLSIIWSKARVALANITSILFIQLSTIWSDCIPDRVDILWYAMIQAKGTFEEYFISTSEDEEMIRSFS